MENMTSIRLNTKLIKRMRGRYTFVSLALLVVLLSVAAYSIVKKPTLMNFAHGTVADISNLKAAWAKGDLIVFVRHAERCDQSTADCLGLKDGITVRGSEAARGVGKEYQLLGLESTDVFASPLPRTSQTATFMFDRPVATQTWLADCRATLLINSIKHKVAGRNLILVTHSDCIREVEKGMKVVLPGKPAYTSSLFVSLGAKDSYPHALGFVEAAPFAADFKHVH